MRLEFREEWYNKRDTLLQHLHVILGTYFTLVKKSVTSGLASRSANSSVFPSNVLHTFMVTAEDVVGAATRIKET